MMTNTNGREIYSIEQISFEAQDCPLAFLLWLGAMIILGKLFPAYARP